MTNRPHYATGSALLVCLVLLVVMTLLVVGGISISTTQEKMTGNTQNKQTSFQAAESALRMGEGQVGNVSNFNGTNGAYPRSKPGDADFPIWETISDGDWQSITIPSSTMSGTVAKNPQAIFEEYGTAYRDENCRLIVPQPPDCVTIIYRITARGWGTNENGFTLLQSTFREN